MRLRLFTRPTTQAAKLVRACAGLTILCLTLTACEVRENNEKADIGEQTYLKLSPLEEHSAISRDIMIKLLRGHYAPMALNDHLSAQILDHYIQKLDASRSYFTQGDIDEFQQFRSQFDEDLTHGKLDAAYYIYNRFLLRTKERVDFLLQEVNEHMATYQFDTKERLEIDREQAPWSENTQALDALWRKRLKNAYLNLLDTQKTPEEIQKTLSRRYKNQLNRLQQAKSEDAFQIYMNAVAELFDPHTQYFSPQNSENFNINMSLSLQGIGAVLQTEDEYTKVVRLVSKGPADKAGQLKPADKIIAVGQGEKGEMVDVIGWRLDEVVSLIRGEKGSTVRLEVIPSSGNGTDSNVIAIVRDEVKLEDQSAKSYVLNLKHNGNNKKLGVINIPAFYIDFKGRQLGQSDYKSTTRDVLKLINELKQQSIDGLVIDLRNNGGGSLEEAINLTGLFIPQGPVVQVKDARGDIQVLNDRNPKTQYAGPMAVLVNRLSASASEIFAGAIQDYGRGLIIGGQTFGKGTVQTLLPVGSGGQLKITQAKFYRISGESTQHQGVVPDVKYPSLFNKEEVGESALDHALPWDTIASAPYPHPNKLNAALIDLNTKHKARIKNDPDFTYLKQQRELIEEFQQQTSISLNEKTRKKERQANEAKRVNIENTLRKAKGQEPIKNIDDLNKEQDAKISDEDKIQRDGALNEAGMILFDGLQFFSKSL